MPIVDGMYEAVLSTYYATVDDGIMDIKKKLDRSRRVRISNIPAGLLEELMPMFMNKDLMVILPEGEEPGEDLKKLCQTATTKSRILVNYKGIEAKAGSVSFADRSFNVIWSGSRILDISSMDYRKCARCLMDTFDTGWRYSQKW